MENNKKRKQEVNVRCSVEIRGGFIMLKHIRNEKGAALPFVVLVFAVLFILGVAFLQTSVSDARQTTWQNNRVQAQYLTQKGRFLCDNSKT